MNDNSRCPCCSKPATEKCPKCGRLYCKTHIHTARMHDPLPADKFVPDEQSKTFITGIMHGLRVHGTWAYENRPLVFQKLDDETLACVAGWADLFPDINEEVAKVKNTLKAAGFKFKDLRHGEPEAQP